VPRLDAAGGGRCLSVRTRGPTDCRVNLSERPHSGTAADAGDALRALRSTVTLVLYRSALNYVAPLQPPRVISATK
jgi:hypothetical protein